MSEQNTEQAIRVGQVTDVHSNWSYQGTSRTASSLTS
jgi:hypothetical protein